MQRDMILVRRILEEIEARTDIQPTSLELPEYDELVVDRHVKMLFDVGYIEGVESQTLSMKVAKIYITDLSMAGHDFIGALKQGDVWEQLTKTFSPKELASVSLSELGKIAGELASRLVRKKLGLD